jgi:hypothetical protein
MLPMVLLRLQQIVQMYPTTLARLPGVLQQLNVSQQVTPAVTKLQHLAVTMSSLQGRMYQGKS